MRHFSASGDPNVECPSSATQTVPTASSLVRDVLDESPVIARRGLSHADGPVALVVDETVPASHRAGRYRTAHRPTPEVPEERMGFLASTVLATASLLFVSAVSLGSMLGSTAILHLVSPARRFDTFRAFHEPLVVG